MTQMGALVIVAKRVLKTTYIFCLIALSYVNIFHFCGLIFSYKILKLDVVDGLGIVSLLNNLERANKAVFLLGGLLLPFQKQMCIMIRKSVSIAVCNIYQLRLAKLCEMEVPWLTR